MNLSNALAKSNKMASVWVLLSRDLMKSLRDSSNCVLYSASFRNLVVHRAGSCTCLSHDLGTDYVS